MTALGDLCSCGDLALPGHELCAGCLADRQAERAQVEAEAAARTAAYEARVVAQEAAA